VALIEIDGSFGEGGGQILRTALSLSAITGAPFHIFNLRKGRAKPGLKRQHLACVKAAGEITSAFCPGAELGSLELHFEPKAIRFGSYSFAIGTAGSTTLLLQTILPILAMAAEPSEVILHGGTHNPMAPPVDYLLEVFRPAVAGLGINFDLELIQHGFYPKGGGSIRARVQPWPERDLAFEQTRLWDWGEPLASVLLANLPASVAEREQKELARALRIPLDRIETQVLPGEVGPGNAVMVRFQAEGRTVLFTAFGEKHKRAEIVAKEGAREAKLFARSRAPVDHHLADQILLYLALGRGGRFLTDAVTEHARTNLEVIRQFLPLNSSFSSLRPDLWEVRIETRKD
jgi:RNA 3'-terminal phosphate cyclase (ATP)